ncbi:uncharacterized protein LOC141856459 [Brevipalpus obovatus]|uniref:uncharacterized protein LOC141856459 n=1 Tax=Brevipalpus obovatus TaxID=246614 RepID=UPI003D9DB6CA
MMIQREYDLSYQHRSKNLRASMSDISSKKPFLLRTLIWFIVCTGFSFQTSLISMVYYGYGTRVDIVMSFPRTIPIPGLTICLNLIANRTFIEKFSNISHHRLSDANILREYAYLPINEVATIDTVDVKIVCHAPVTGMKKIVSNSDDLCENYIPLTTTMQYNSFNGYVMKCFTYFYQPYDNSKIQATLGNDKVIYKIDFVSEQNHEVSISIHNPMEILHYLEADTIYFNTTHVSEFVLLSSRSVTKLLSSPYRTNCQAYDHLEMGRTSCVYECRQKEPRELCGTWSKSVPSPIFVNTTFKIHGKKCPDAKNKICNSKDACSSQCVNNWYTTTRIWSELKRDKNPVTRLYVRGGFNQGLEVTYLFEPALDAIEYICYVASLAGIWLGVAFSDMIKMSMEILAKRYQKFDDTKSIRVKKIPRISGHKHEIAFYLR